MYNKIYIERQKQAVVVGSNVSDGSGQEHDEERTN